MWEVRSRKEAPSDECAVSVLADVLLRVFRGASSRLLQVSSDSLYVANFHLLKLKTQSTTSACRKQILIPGRTSYSGLRFATCQKCIKVQ